MRKRGWIGLNVGHALNMIAMCSGYEDGSRPMGRIGAIIPTRRYVWTG